MAPLPVVTFDPLTFEDKFESLPRSNPPRNGPYMPPDIRLRDDDGQSTLDPPIPDILPLFPRSLGLDDSAFGDKNVAQAEQLLAKRQVYISNLPATYKGINAGPPAGTVVGIVLGVVLGYVLVFWLIIALINAQSFAPQFVEGDDTEIVVRRGHESSRRSRRSHRSRRGGDDPPPPDVTQLPPRRRSERVIVEETTRRAGSRPPPPPASVRENISVNIRESVRESSRGPPTRVPGDDMVEVIEEDSTTTASAVTPDPPRKPKSGFRTVDPYGYGGGNYPRQEYRSRSKSRRG